MGTPIRWDNVNGGGLSEASRPLDSAANLFQNAFSGLQDALKEREAIDAANQQNTVKNNTTAYLDAVANLGNPDAVRAAQGQGGSLAELRQKFGYQIDADKVRGAADQRVAALQDMAQKDILYRHSQLDEATSKDVQAFQMARMKGDKAGMDAAMSSYMGKGGRDPTGLLKFADERDWLVNERGMKLENHQASMDQISNAIRHDKVMETISQTNANTQAQQVQQQGQFQTWQMNNGDADRASAKAAGQAVALKNSLREDGNLYAEGQYTGNNADELRKFLKDTNAGKGFLTDIGQADRQANVMKKLDQLAHDGIPLTDPDGKAVIDPTTKKPMVIHQLPMAAVKSALGSLNNDFWTAGWNSGPANNLEAALKERLGKAIVNKDGTVSNKALDDFRTFTAAVTKATENAPAIAPTRAAPSVYTPGKRK